MTTEMFSAAIAKAKAAFRGQRQPVASPSFNQQQSAAQGIVQVPVPAAMPTSSGPATEIPLGPKPADVEDVRLGYKFQMQQVSIGGHSSAEMGGRGERSGALVDGR